MTLERPRHIKTGADAREALMAGFGHAAKLAGLTLGPHGGRVVLERADDYPELTRDGFTAIRDLEDEDRFATLGTELLKACVQEDPRCGGRWLDHHGPARRRLRRVGLAPGGGGDRPALGQARLRGAHAGGARGTRTAEQPGLGPCDAGAAAGVAADGDGEIADLVAEAVERLGAEGVVNISYHQGVDTTVDYMRGMAFEHGLLSRNFLLKAGETEVKLDQPFLLMCQGELTETAQLLPALEGGARGQAGACWCWPRTFPTRRSRSCSPTTARVRCTARR